MNLESVLDNLYNFTQDALLVFEATSESVSDPRIVFANQSFLSMAGYTLEEIIGQRLAHFEGEDTDPVVIADMRRHMADHLQCRSQVQHYRKDGRPYWVDLSLFPAHDSNGTYHYWVSVQRDITAYRHQQEALDAAEAERLSAQQAIDAKSRFLANMSHELRTPMNGVIGVTELLLETELDADQQKYANTVLGSAESLLGLLNDILDYSKIEAGKLEIDSVPVDLLVLIEDVVDLLAVRARDREVDLLVHYPQNVPRFLIGDPLRLRQVLFNLVGNAVKFTEQGHVLITVMNQDDGKLKISIEDTGIGIPQDKLNAIFGKFNQLDVSTTRKFGGTGLGLAISQSLVSLMGGGDIGVESTLDEGSTFSFEIHAVPNDNAVEPPFHDRPLSGRRVLIVDDEDLNCRIFKEMLENTGMACVMVQSGPQALEALGKAHAEGPPFDAVLLDFSMPIMNGEQTAMAIKVMPGMAEVITVMISAADETRDQARLQRAGLSAWLTKPVRREQLGSLFASLLEAKRQEKNGSPAFASRMIRSSPGAVVCHPNFGIEQSDPPTLEGLEVLLVEDNRINQKVAAERLKGLSCLVTVAENGREAVEKVQRNAFDLILMDCQMPEMDGYEATQKIRELSANGKIAPLPIIALTANAMAGDRQKCLSAGMDDYMSKPVRKENLMAALCKWAPPKKVEPAAKSLPDPVVNPSKARSDALAATTTTISVGVATVPEAVAEPAAAAPSVARDCQPVAPVVSAPCEADYRDLAVTLGDSVPQAHPNIRAELNPDPGTAPSYSSKADVLASDAASLHPDKTEGLDGEILDGIRESMGEQFGIILQYYLEDANDYIAQIERGGTDDNVKSIVAPAHTLKSSSREIGALLVSEIAQQIEHHARQVTESDADPAPIGRLIQDLAPAFEQTKSQLQQLIN